MLPRVFYRFTVWWGTQTPGTSRYASRVMRKIPLFLVTTVAIGVLVAAAAASSIVKVGPKANGSVVRLRTSDILVVSLPGNATTGFAWKVRSVNRTVLKPISTKYVPRPSGGKVGTGGTFVLRFRADQAGRTRLVLGYMQSGSTSAAKTFSLRVFVVKPLPRV